MSERTPGPFDEEAGAIFRLIGQDNHGRELRRMVALPHEVLDDEEIEEMVDLLNKGTYFARLLPALNDCLGGLEKTASGLEMVERAINNIAAETGREQRLALTTPDELRERLAQYRALIVEAEGEG